MGSNRTFMELKFLQLQMVCRTLNSSNRTFMELKYLNSKHMTVRKVSSNRTFMELKYMGKALGHRFLSVLIVPLWN